MLRSTTPFPLNLRLFVLALLVLARPGQTDTPFDAPGNFNPIVPGYFADPTLRKFGDTYYLYATTDGNGGGRGPAVVWASRDFVNWTLIPMNWPSTPFYWAPDVVHRPDGRYYLYYNQPCMTHGGVSDTPTGPWTPLVPGDNVVVRDHLIPNVITLDSQLFQDKDGALYMYWGTWGIFANSGCGIGKLKADMKSFSGFSMIPNTQAKDFFEAPFMLERDGVYYFTYSSGSCHDASYRVQYATSDRPDGTFTMGPNNPILASTRDGTVHGPGHHSILTEGKNDYIVYHRHDIPFTPNGMHRQVCVDRLIIEKPGVIRAVQPTHQGVGPLSAAAPQLRNLAFNRPVTASSFYRDTLRKHDYKPQYAVDDNNATLWRPADNAMGHWLMVDLGSIQRIRQTQSQFEYGTWYYQYLIEHSRDGQTWSVFADRRQNTRWGSPMIDRNDVEARYLRLTVTGVEYPGLFGSLWNFKVFGDAPQDPLEALADKAFAASPRRPAPSAAPTRGLLVHLDAADLPPGAAVARWKNKGALAGDFAADGSAPVVEMALGRKALRFTGREFLRGSVPSPRSLAGNSSFTFAAWVLNPEISDSECLISWAGRGGPDAATAQIGYGTQSQFGAVGHWGFADMGFAAGPPKAGAWHHIAVTFDGVVERIYVDGQLNASEAKMLLMHEGRPIYVGASEPGNELFDGYLASLRLYDKSMTAEQIKQLALAEPEADVLLHADAAQLDFGPLPAWRNDGTLGASLAGPNPPAVGPVAGRIAVRFAPGQSLELAPSTPVSLPSFTLLLTAHIDDPQATLATLIGVNASIPLRATSAKPGWHQLALVGANGQHTLFIDGQPAPAQPVAAPLLLKSIKLAGDGPAALTRIQLFRRALAAPELADLHAAWLDQARAPFATRAEFAQPPAPLTPRAVTMAAKPPSTVHASVKYLFTQTGPTPPISSGWVATPTFLASALTPDTRYTYTVRLRDVFGNISNESAPAEVLTDSSRFDTFTDRFTSEKDYLAGGFDSALWQGVLCRGDNAADAVLAGNGVLRLQSHGTTWDGNKPHGPLLYRLVKGDFVAEVKIADYAGLANRRVPGNNDGGLMVRVPSLADAGPGEDLVQLSFFPIYDQGNMWTSLDSGGRPQRGNRLAWNAHRWLQVERRGDAFHLRTSPDGKQWFDMPGSPILRPDMANLPVHVGLCHASYGRDESFITFSDFALWVRKQ